MKVSLRGAVPDRAARKAALADDVEVPCAGEEELPEPRPPIPSDRLGAVFEVDALCHAVSSRN